MSSLIVYLGSDGVGRLEQDDDGLLQFQYDREWLDKPGAIPLSRSLPLQVAPFSGRKARPFFAGVLPEGLPRQKVAQILGITETNDFAMLERIGGECAGAVRTLPDGDPAGRPGEVRRHPLSERELEELIAELPRRPLMAGKDGIRLSLAGAQDKLPVIATDGKIALPLADTPSTHILKPEPERFPGLAANEYLCMTLAREVGVPVAGMQYMVVGETPCVLVERFDREFDKAGNTIRIHQEDFCQAMGFPPERKYQAENGPTLKDCVSLLREWSTAPAADIPRFVNSLIFNVIIGNADAHGKNFSILYSRGERRLAPGYDLVSTAAWPELSGNLAMKIGACDSINAFTLGDWRRMAATCRLGWSVVRERMAEGCETVLARIDDVRAGAVECIGEAPEPLYEAIRERARKLRKAIDKV